MPVKFSGSFGKVCQLFYEIFRAASQEARIRQNADCRFRIAAPKYRLVIRPRVLLGVLPLLLFVFACNSSRGLAGSWSSANLRLSLGDNGTGRMAPTEGTPHRIAWSASGSELRIRETQEDQELVYEYELTNGGRQLTLRSPGLKEPQVLQRIR
jgi:hypothetical protein